MTDLFIGSLIIAAYILAGVFVARMALRRLTIVDVRIRLPILAGIYAGFFGIGILGGGGDPGFAFPAPIAVATALGVWLWIDWAPFVRGVVIPFIFWWVLIVAYMVFSRWIKQRGRVKQIG